MPNLFKDMEKPFLPMMISNWIFGIGIIEYPIGRPRKVLSFIYTSIILFSYLYLSYAFYSYHTISKLAKMKPITTSMFYYTNIIVAVSVLIAGWFQSQGLHECMLKAALANRLLQKIGIPKNHSKILKTELFRFLTFFAYIMTVIIVNCSITAWKRDIEAEEIFAMFVQNFPIIVVFIADSSFMNILGYAYYKFDSLNEMLQNLLTSTPDVPLYQEIAKQAAITSVRSQNDYNTEEKDYTFIVETGKLVHLQLTKLCRKANKTYGFHLLISIAVAFMMMINNIFNIYLCLNYSFASIVTIKEIARSLNWFLYFWIKTVINSRFYTTVSKSALATGDVICELYDEHSINENTKAEIRRFNIELIQNKLKLSACGIVKIDLTLIPTMVAAIGTYFIIIIQFQKVNYAEPVDIDE